MDARLKTASRLNWSPILAVLPCLRKVEQLITFFLDVLTERPRERHRRPIESHESSNAILSFSFVFKIEKKSFWWLNFELTPAG